MVIEGRLEGERGRGIGMLDDFGVSFPDLKRWAEDRKEWRRREFPCRTLDLPLRQNTHTSQLFSPRKSQTTIFLVNLASQLMPVQTVAVVTLAPAVGSASGPIHSQKRRRHLCAHGVD